MELFFFTALQITSIVYVIYEAIKKKKTISNHNKAVPDSISPTLYFHGTTMDNALEIYNTGLWLVGDSEPKGIYLTDSMEVAKYYSEKSGAIVVVNVSPGIKLTQKRKRYFVYEIPDALIKREYYIIKALKPIGILSPDGKKIK